MYMIGRGILALAIFNTVATNAFSSTTINASSNIQSNISQKELFEKLKLKLTEIEKLNGVKGLLGWDEMVMLSPGSASARNDQKAALSGVVFEKQTDISLKTLLDNMIHTDLNTLSNDYERSIVRDALRDYELTVRKSKEMTMRESDLEGRGYQAWVGARQKSDFAEFSSVLQEIVAIKAEIAAVTHPHLSAYDANIDLFERGMKAARLNEIFSVVKQELWYCIYIDITHYTYLIFNVFAVFLVH